MQMTIPLGVLTVGLLVKPKIRVVTTLPGEGVRVNAGSAIVGQGDSIPPPPLREVSEGEASLLWIRVDYTVSVRASGKRGRLVGP